MPTNAKKSRIRGLYKRGDIWYCRIAGLNGQLIRKRLSADKATALLILAEMRKTIELQRAGILPEKVVKADADLRSLREMFLNHMKAGSRSYGTIDLFLHSYTTVIEKNHFTRVSDITIQKLEAWATARLSAGTRGQTINIYVGRVRHFLGWAKM